MARSQFTLKYLFLETAVVALALGAWRLMLALPDGYQLWGWLAILLTASPAVAGLFGPRHVRAGFYFCLALVLLLAFNVAVIAVSVYYQPFPHPG
jgi:hypothetical protein